MTTREALPATVSAFAAVLTLVASLSLWIAGCKTFTECIEAAKAPSERSLDAAVRAVSVYEEATVRRCASPQSQAVARWFPCTTSQLTDAHFRDVTPIGVHASTVLALVREDVAEAVRMAETINADANWNTRRAVKRFIASRQAHETAVREIVRRGGTWGEISRERGRARIHGHEALREVFRA